jgi:hypothetical protein
VFFEISQMERIMLNLMFGRALCNDELGHALLRRRTRENVLLGYPFSPNLRAYLMSIADVPDLADLARHVDNVIQIS